jgi:hypothetical protein
MLWPCKPIVMLNAVKHLALELCASLEMFRFAQHDNVSIALQLSSMPVVSPKHVAAYRQHVQAYARIPLKLSLSRVAAQAGHTPYTITPSLGLSW